MTSLINEFKKFALRGNLIDLAVGFTVGAAFSTIAKSLVDDIVMPVVGLLLGDNEFADLFLLLKAGTPAGPYDTLAAAQEAGAVTVNYGLFVNSIVTFLLVALVMFFLIRGINRLEELVEEELHTGSGDDGQSVPTKKKCPYCYSTIPRQATRCPECTSHLEGTPEAKPAAESGTAAAA